MYYRNTVARLLVKTLKKNGWSQLLDSEDVWLVNEPYHVLIKESRFFLFCNIKQGETLSLISSFKYGRRQTQLLGRAVEKHRRETVNKCINSVSDSKAVRRG
jgi:hypothetical protein